MNKTDLLILAVGVAGAAFILLRKPTSTSSGTSSSSAGGSPENVYSGQAANRAQLQRELDGLDFWI